MSQKDINTLAHEKAFLNRLEKKKQQLSYVTEETLSQFQLKDVEMIVPGHGIAYPRVCIRCQVEVNLDIRQHRISDYNHA